MIQDAAAILLLLLLALQIRFFYSWHYTKYTLLISEGVKV
jgi:hypothetical protein